jgi:site-specific recombinase XerD
MSRPRLSLVQTGNVSAPRISFEEKLADHQAILRAYTDTLYTRNFSTQTIHYTERFLYGWFANLSVADGTHPDGHRQLLIWEAMKPVLGRQYIVAFSKGLICSELKAGTIIGYLGYLRRLFEYVLEFPHIPGDTVQYIAHKYGPIEQPVSEYDYPVHALDHEQEGFALTLKELVELYDYVRTVYVQSSQKKHAAGRDYSMLVLAGESGLRADEIIHLDVKGLHCDLFYDKGRVQTRYAKGMKGSGKRTRKTIFTPFAKATIFHYEQHFRPQFINADTETALYLSERGQRISYNAMWRNLQLIVKSARADGLSLPPKLGWHDLRRTFATIFSEKYPELMWVLMDALGHVNPSTLNRYIKHRRAYYEKALDAVLDDLIPDND